MIPVSDKNRLSIVKPELIEEWNYEKNYPLTPHEVSCSCGKKVWWKCKEGHEWKVRIADRTSQKNNRKKKFIGCPYCSRRKVSDKNRLSAFYPTLCKEWNYEKNYPLTPDDVSYGSVKKVWWKCDKGHEWEAIIESRCKKPRCPCCTGRKASKENNVGNNPLLVSEWNYEKNSLKPSDYSSGSDKSVWWKCRNGHEWKCPIFHRKNGTGCPICYKKIEMDDGIKLRSKIEAYFYLKLRKKFKLEIEKSYGLENYICDFYIPKYNTYIEVTSFHENAQGYGKRIWKDYINKIEMKRKYVEDILHAKFRFWKINYLNKKQISFLMKHMKIDGKSENFPSLPLDRSF